MTPLYVVTLFMFGGFLVLVMNIDQWLERWVVHLQCINHSLDEEFDHATIQSFSIKVLRVKVSDKLVDTFSEASAAIGGLPCCLLMLLSIMCPLCSQWMHFRWFFSFILFSSLFHLSLCEPLLLVRPSQPSPPFFAKSIASGPNQFSVLITAFTSMSMEMISLRMVVIITFLSFMSSTKTFHSSFHGILQRWEKLCSSSLNLVIVFPELQSASVSVVEGPMQGL